jgi:hypothetical protein
MVVEVAPGRVQIDGREARVRAASGASGAS